MGNNKYMILLVSRVNHRTFCLCSGSTSVLGMETWAGAEWGLLSAQHWGRRCRDEHQVKDLGCPGQGCANSAPVVQHEA